MDFLIYMEVLQLPAGEEGDGLLAAERERARELAAIGCLRRLWRVPGRRANWGIWSAKTADELHEALTSLPLFPYLAMTVHALAKHPNDPGESLAAGLKDVS